MARVLKGRVGCLCLYLVIMCFVVGSSAIDLLAILVSEMTYYSHRSRCGWNSGGRMASAEGGSVPNGVWYGEGCPLSSRLGSLGERCELPRGFKAKPRPKTYFGVF